MQLIAAEPLVTDPVAIAYDEFARAYVAEMSDYPYTDKAAHQPAQENPTDEAIGKIRLLEDTNGDGVFDTATVFAEGLSWPTGVACWRGGVYVTATPDLWYLKDTDGDGVADIRRKVYTGFRKYNVQAVMNNPKWGLDHHLYIAGGSNGGEVRPGDEPEAEPLVFRRNDLRLDPLTEALVLESGGARFGHSFDDYGNRFLCNIRNPAQHVVISKRALDRNPVLPPFDPVHDVVASGDSLPVYRTSPPETWRVERARRWSREEAENHPQSELVSAGVVTSSAGVTVYRGDAYPAEYRGQIFVADVAGNLFYRLQIEPDGATFTGKRADPAADFVASDDIWFRPVNFENAPDGCLHVLDMYREAIEHPWSIPDDIHARLDLERGRDRGRIFRLAPPGYRFQPPPRLGELSTEELVPLLGHPNAWTRETAHRLIFERQDVGVVEALREMAAGNGDKSGGEESRNGSYHADLARIHALWSLDGLGALTGEDLVAQLHPDTPPRVLEQALILATPRLADSVNLREHVLSLSEVLSKDGRTAMALAIACGEIPQGDGAAAGVLAELLLGHADDPFVTAAALSSLSGRAHEVLAQVKGSLSLEELIKPETGALVRRLAYATGAEAGPVSLSSLLGPEAGGLGEASPTLLLGLAEGLRRQRSSLRAAAKQAGNTSADLTDLANRLVSIANDPSAEPTARATVLELLPHVEAEQVADVALPLLVPETPPAVQAAAIAALGVYPDATLAEPLLQRWPAYSPSLRLQVTQLLLATPEGAALFLDALEAGSVMPQQLDSASRRLLTRHRDETVRQRATAFFETANQERAAVLEDYLAKLDPLTGDPAKGQAVYQTHCMVCHRLGEQGNDIGPNLATVRLWTREQILTNVLDPNREVSPNFSTYFVETTDGASLAGSIASETSDAIALAQPGSTQAVIPRSEIRSLTDLGVSLMPEGLEAAIPPQQMADLIAFLQAAPAKAGTEN